MKDQPWDLNRTWPVGRKWCRFTNAPKFLGPFPKLGRKKHQILDHVFATSALDNAYLWKDTSHRQTKTLVSIYDVCPKRWLTFRDLWPRNGWDSFRHCDPPFGGHYVATIIVTSCLVSTRKSPLDVASINLATFFCCDRELYLWPWHSNLTWTGPSWTSLTNIKVKGHLVQLLLSGDTHITHSSSNH